jgi:hypothetical protein
VGKPVKDLLDLLQATIAERRIILNEKTVGDRLEEIAAAMTSGLGFRYGSTIYLRPQIQAKILSFNQLYAQCIILRITEIQPQHSEEEIFLTTELFSLLPSKVTSIVINNMPYLRCGNRAKNKGRALKEEEILSEVIDD